MPASAVVELGILPLVKDTDSLAPSLDFAVGEHLQQQPQTLTETIVQNRAGLYQGNRAAPRQGDYISISP